MVDYSSWDKGYNISDDEDDTHPNVDTPSLFRWRHENRLLEMEELEQERSHIAKMKEELAKRKTKLEQRRETGQDVSALEKVYNSDLTELTKAEQSFIKKEKQNPWNVDTMSQEVFSKTIINSTPMTKTSKVETDEEKAERLNIFVTEKKQLLQKFGMLRKPEDSKKFLQDNPELVVEATADYLTFWCLELAMEQKLTLMEHVSHQCVSMQFLLSLAKQLDTDPRACLSSFFSRIDHPEQSEYRQVFDKEVELLRGRIVRRAEEKLQKMEVEEEEVEVTLGPGGLDPVEVFHSLPDVLKKCFDSKDIPMLQKAIAEMPEKEARYHMKRCVDSGLWSPPEPSKEELEEEEEPSGIMSRLFQYCNIS